MKNLWILFYSALLMLATGTQLGAQQTATEAYLLILNKSGDSVWQLNAQTGERIAEYPTGKAPHEVAVSPDRSRAIVTNYGADSPGNTLTILDLNRQRVSDTISLGKYQRPHGVEWFSDGRRAIVTAEEQQAVLIVDIVKGTVRSAINTGQRVSHMVTLSPDEKRAYVTNLGSGSLTIVDLEKENVLHTMETGSGTEGVTTVGTRQEVWITNRSANTVSVIDPSQNRILETLESSAFPIRAETSPDGRRVAVSNARSSEVTVFDVESRRQIAKVSTVEGSKKGMPIGLTFSDDGRYLFVSNSNLNHIAVIDTGSWTLVNRYPTGATPDGIAYVKPEE